MSLVAEWLLTSPAEPRDRISVHPKFVSGELDMDNLCSELRAKAKCSETGVVVGERDVEEVLSKVGLKLREVSQQPN